MPTYAAHQGGLVLWYGLGVTQLPHLQWVIGRFHINRMTFRIRDSQEIKRHAPLSSARHHELRNNTERSTGRRIGQQRVKCVKPQPRERVVVAFLAQDLSAVEKKHLENKNRK